MDPRPAVVEIARKHGLAEAFPDAVLREAEAWVQGPGIDDPRLVDRTDLPFVTIDNLGSRDLDQAMCIARSRDGWVVHYALADAAWFVRPGTPLFAEGLRRGASYYLPGWSIPMLPRVLSENLVSLGPGVRRRAMLWSFTLDAGGEITAAELVRARIQSRAQLTYAGVQSFHDAPAGHALAGQPWSETLLLLREVGQARLALAAARDVIPVRSAGVEVELADGALPFRAIAAPRLEVEAWNERVSVMTNVAAAVRLSSPGPAPVQAIYRVHPGPDPRRLEELAALIDETVRLRGLPPAAWSWRRERGEALPAYLARLPREAGTLPLVRAIERQALLVNQRSLFTDAPGRHHGLGATEYARVTAPMREIVGVFTHKELWEREGGYLTPDAEDDALRARVIAAGNSAKALQAALDKDVNRVVIDAHLAAAAAPLPGVIMGLAPDKYYVQLEGPPLELKVYRRDMAAGPDLALGDRVAVRVLGKDGRRDRWKLDLELRS